MQYICCICLDLFRGVSNRAKITYEILKSLEIGDLEIFLGFLLPMMLDKAHFVQNLSD